MASPFKDTFVDSSVTNLESHTPSGGTAWTLQSGSAGTFKTVGGSAAGLKCSTGTLGWYSCDSQGSADQYVTVTLSNLANYGLAAVCRATDANNWVGYYNPGTGGVGSRLSKKISGTITDLITWQPVAGDVNKVVCSGSTIQVFQNGTQKGTNQTVTNFTSVIPQGLTNDGGFSSGTIITYFEAGTLGGGGSVGSATGSASVSGKSGSKASAAGAASSKAQSGSKANSTGQAAVAGQSGSKGSSAGQASVSGRSGSLGSAAGSATVIGRSGSKGSASGGASVSGVSLGGSTAVAAGVATVMGRSGSIAIAMGSCTVVGRSPSTPVTTELLFLIPLGGGINLGIKLS